MLESSGDIKNRASSYAAARGMRVEHRLGYGKDGTVFSTSMATAIKVHVYRESYERELAGYRRLRDYEVIDVLGHSVPRLLGSDDQLRVIEMTIVRPPFLLDFASAYLGHEAPDFSDEVLEQWREEKMERFGEHWAEVEAILGFLRSRFGIHLTDVHPANIRFGPGKGE
jgi:hypothetical protein